MSLGITPPSADLYRSVRELCEEKLSATSIYRLLAEQGHRLFADETLADLFEDVGRRSVPPRIVATVMVLQRIEGALSLPYELRQLAAFKADVLTAVARIFVEAVFAVYRQRAKRHGLEEAQCGAVTFRAALRQPEPQRPLPRHGARRGLRPRPFGMPGVSRFGAAHACRPSGCRRQGAAPLRRVATPSGVSGR
jgi:hypothetical protein